MKKGVFMKRFAPALKASALSTLLICTACDTVNPAMMSVNETIEGYVFSPAAEGWRYVTPGGVRRGVNNAFDNLQEPVRIANQALQGNFAQAGDSTARFAVNTTAGGLGLFDVATDMGYEKSHADLGQTLGMYGVPSGPFMVLPLLGPTTPRDFAGGLGDGYADPLHYAIKDQTASTVVGVGTGINSLSVGMDEEEKIFEAQAKKRGMTAEQLAAALEASDAESTLDKRYAELKNDYEKERAAAIKAAEAGKTYNPSNISENEIDKAIEGQLNRRIDIHDRF
jgi:ABC-type transporter lipoprotein component MlaA